MNHPDPATARAAVNDASRLQQRAARATKWFTGYLAIVGVGLLAWVLALGLVPATPGRYVVWLVGLVIIAALRGWLMSHDVRPDARGRVLVTMAISVGLFLCVYVPLVAVGGTTSFAVWCFAAAATALPFLVAAVVEWRRQ